MMKKEETKKHPILKIIFILLVTIFCLLLYSRFVSTSGLKVKEYHLTNYNITDNFNGFKIIHISDIHYGRVINNKRLEEIVEKINSLKPDIVVLTGDLIDRNVKLEQEDIELLTKTLLKINVTIDKYAIKGNHDYYFNEWETVIENSNFINLGNKYELIYKNGYDPILIAGLNSMQENISFATRFENIQQEINKENIKSIYNILLVHEPDPIDEINLDNYQLVLGGHSHNGQVRLPLIGPLVKADGAKKYYDEHYKIGNTELYISSGLGTTGLDFRFFNKPSFNLYRITNK